MCIYEVRGCEIVCICVLDTQSWPTLCDPLDCSLPGSSVHGDSQGKNTGVGCHALFQGIFPTQGSNLGLPHRRQILCTQYASKFGKLSSGQRTRKSQFSFQSQRKAMQKCSNYHTIALISHASKEMLKTLQARLQLYVNCELPDVQAGFRKSRGTRDQIANISWIITKAREFQKNIYFCFIDISNCGKFLKRGEYHTT